MLEIGELPGKHFLPDEFVRILRQLGQLLLLTQGIGVNAQGFRFVIYIIVGLADGFGDAHGVADAGVRQHVHVVLVQKVCHALAHDVVIMERFAEFVA